MKSPCKPKTSRSPSAAVVDADGRAMIPCSMPGGTDNSFTTKLHRVVADQQSTKYVPSRFVEGFSVKHYAGTVEYLTDGWLEKNKDPLNPDLTTVIASSTVPYVATLFSELAEEASARATGRGGNKKGGFRTVGQRHKEQLGSLMRQLGSTQPHFVRCIVPNAFKQPGRIDTPLVLHQLRCNGVLEGIRIARLGYPNRHSFLEFRQRYEILTPNAIPKGYVDSRNAYVVLFLLKETRRLTAWVVRRFSVLAMTEAMQLNPTVFKVGLTKIFFKAGVLAELEERRDELLYHTFTAIQAACRRFVARRQTLKILNRASAVRTIQRNARIYNELKDWPWWQLYIKVRPLLAATRDDEELKRKAAELALAKERAERDVKEKERLEEMRRTLEHEKRMVEEAFESERALLAEKDASLARSKKHEEELEEDIAELDSQLSRTMEAHKKVRAQHDKLKLDFDLAHDLIIRLEEEKRAWLEREAALSNAASGQENQCALLTDENAKLKAQLKELTSRLSEREEDVGRVKGRLATETRDLGARLAAEVKVNEDARRRNESLDKELREAKERLGMLKQTVADHEEGVRRKETNIAELQARVATITRERDGSVKQASELKLQIDSMTEQASQAKTERSALVEARAKVERDLDDLRNLMAAKRSEEEKFAQVRRQQDEELVRLREQATKLADSLSLAKREATQEHVTLSSEVRMIWS
jgi:myosin protein heavy chain